MKQIQISLSLLLLLLPPLTLSTTTPTLINIWPKPLNLTFPALPKSTLLSPTFQIHSPNHPHLLTSSKRYTHLLLSEHHHPIIPPSINLSSTSPPLQSLTITVHNLLTPLTHAVDESYTLTVSSPSAHLTSHTPWGAIRGLETFSQLVWGYPPRIPIGVRVSDRPIFPHRGVLLDTSRNYYPVADILRTIKAMGENKLNVFHWHITDSHSFPIVLPSVPALSTKGSYGEAMRYSPEDVKRIVDFAASYAIRVVPEIDMPGHTGSWAEAYPEIVTCANMFWTGPKGTAWADRLASEPGTGQLNPLHPKTYEVVRDVIHDVASLFPEKFFHAGGDEVVPGCWKTDPMVRSFVSKGGTMDELLEMFVNSTRPYIVSLNRTAVYWEDVLLDATVKVNRSTLPPETTILQTWNNGPKNTKSTTSAGYRTIVSSADFYYLDCGHGGWVGNDSQYDRQTGDGGNGGSWCAPFKTWQRVYDYDITYGLTEEEAKLVLGGEVALWSEQADPTVLDARIWPRASAMAEALWSGNRDSSGKKRYADATDRLNEWRYRMIGRGVGAEPIQPLWCVTHPGMCNASQ
ncbi:Beta-hexosaminidase 2 [Acorus gramineus]|uniref:Beta-hexosaminidase n=1 Tax=Acorus gramineus TaxID=55184 RepID=A0AAV9A5M3_ACOGR|nr:Beta-hexosaminidase 2 [Acorus gramineus]